MTSITGLGATLIYFTTFYLTSYNELYFSGASGLDDSDVSYTLAIVECVATASTFIIGTLAFASAKKPSRGTIFVAALFLAAGVILQGTIGIVRSWNLGVIGDSERTCSDEGMTGCPTTRFEAFRGRDILFSEPYGGQCSFWFWEPMRARFESTETVNSCNGFESFSEGINCDGIIENNMNWAKSSSYGWRDNTDEMKLLMTDTSGSVTIGKVHNMEILYKLQSDIESKDNTTIPTGRRFSSQPTIAYCWYWGCSQVCNGHRYAINRMWLALSFSLTALHFISAVLAAIVYKRLKPVLEIPEAKEIELEEGDTTNFIVPKVGRRRRLQNPSGLLF